MDDGTAPVDEVIRVLTTLQSALRHIAESIEDESRGRRRGRPKRRISEEITLRLIEVTHSSFGAVLELPPAPLQERIWDTGEAALEELVQSLEDVARNRSTDHVRKSALPEIQQLASGYGEGITRVTFSGFARTPRTAEFELGVPLQLVQPPSPPRRRASISGRLREVDFKDHTAELYDSTGKMTRVIFSEEQATEVKSAANLFVTASGELAVSPGGTQSSIVLDSLAPREGGDAFWDHREVSELAERQGIRPLSTQGLRRATFWPDDLDPRDFVAIVNSGAAADDASI